MLAAIPITALVGKSQRNIFLRIRRWIGYVAGGIVLLLTVCYGLAYQHIYSQPLTYVQASQWIYAHLPAGTRISQNSLDNSLPLGLGAQQDPSIYQWAGSDSLITSDNPFPTYDDDSLAKVQTMAAVLSHAQYYFENSRRAIESFESYGSKYPFMQHFYALLLDNKLHVQDPLGYTMVARFVEHPQLGPWTDTEQGVNQNFDEYDHPQIEVFENTGNLSINQIVAVITDNGRIQDPALSAPGTTITTLPKSLMLSAKDIETNQKNPTYADMFPAGALPMRFPAPVWWLMIEALGLLALPISMRLFGKLGDCGFVVSKTVGILLLAWFAWILASLRIAEYSRQEIALCLIPIAAISLAWGPRLADIPRILRRALARNRADRGRVQPRLPRLPLDTGHLPGHVAHQRRRREDDGLLVHRSHRAQPGDASARPLVQRRLPQLLLLRPLHRRHAAQAGGHHAGDRHQPRHADLLRLDARHGRVHRL